jgi:hypothetical protein
MTAPLSGGVPAAYSGLAVQECADCFGEIGPEEIGNQQVVRSIRIAGSNKTYNFP